MSAYDLLRAEAAIPGVPLETILCTEKLRSRPCRAADYEKENRALVALASALVDSQSSILQTLAETILEVDSVRLVWAKSSNEGRWRQKVLLGGHLFTTKTSGVGIRAERGRAVAHGELDQPTS